MEYWFAPKNKDKEYINQCLNSQLYSAVLGENEHFTKPKMLKTLRNCTLFEAIEIISQLDINKKYLINPLGHDNEINFKLIKHIMKNKNQLKHIQLAPLFYIDEIGKKVENTENTEFEMSEAINCVNYGVDYICIFSTYNQTDDIDDILDIIRWISEFRDKGLYKTKIIVNNIFHEYCMSYLSDINYDGVVYTDGDIIHGEKYIT